MEQNPKLILVYPRTRPSNTQGNSPHPFAHGGLRPRDPAVSDSALEWHGPAHWVEREARCKAGRPEPCFFSAPNPCGIFVGSAVLFHGGCQQAYVNPSDSLFVEPPLPLGAAQPTRSPPFASADSQDPPLKPSRRVEDSLKRSALFIIFMGRSDPFEFQVSMSRI